MADERVLKDCCARNELINVMEEFIHMLKINSPSTVHPYLGMLNWITKLTAIEVDFNSRYLLLAYLFPLIAHSTPGNSFTKCKIEKINTEYYDKVL